MKCYNEELKQLFGYFDILSFVRISRLDWTGHVNRMNIKRKVSQVFKDNHQASRVRGRPKNRWLSCVLYKQILVMQNYTMEREVKKQSLEKSI
jgi:hypothetical protein